MNRGVEIVLTYLGTPRLLKVLTFATRYQQWLIHAVVR